MKNAGYRSSGLRFRRQLDNSVAYAANLLRALNKLSSHAATTYIVFATRTSYSYTNGNAESVGNALFALKKKKVYSDSVYSSFTTGQWYRVLILEGKFALCAANVTQKAFSNCIQFASSVPVAYRSRRPVPNVGLTPN